MEVHPLSVRRTDATMRVPTMLSDDWTLWLRENLERGCAPDALVRTMLAGRIDGAVASQAVARALAEIGAAQTPCASCWPDRFAFRVANRATVGGRRMEAVARLQRPAAVLLDNVL